MKRGGVVWILGLLLSCVCLAQAEEITLSNVPDVLRPGKQYDFALHIPQEGTLSMVLTDESLVTVYPITEGFPVKAGDNLLTWDGVRTDQTAVEKGDYRLVIRMDGTDWSVTTPLRIGAPYPMLTHIQSSDLYVARDAPCEITFYSSHTGRVSLVLKHRGENEPICTLAEQAVVAGENVIVWDGTTPDGDAPAGSYSLMLTLQTPNGAESTAHHIALDVLSEAGEAPLATIESAATSSPKGMPSAVLLSDAEHAVSPDPGATSAPYSTEGPLSYWTMTPGETDDAIIWDVLTQPIVVYDGGIGQAEHAYLMENPDGTGNKVAQIHGQSQGLHVLGEKNANGYVLAEAFSNYSPDYQPGGREEISEVKRGYIKASALKTVQVEQDMGLVIDKLTQRMYLFIDGKRVTEFLIATGKLDESKMITETPAGEYVTISWVGGFWSGNMYCDMGIRINGGILLHEVPHKVNADQSKNYAAFEAYLGSKQSHGCVRIQRLKTPEGYNHAWLWNNLKRNRQYKVIIWDDVGRVDQPTTWQQNPDA
ncbi:MAG: L,D-transpeptidase [Clostridia bacterium]